MIRTSPTTQYRAAAAFVAAAVLSFTSHHASAQQTVDLLGGTLGTPTMLSLVGNGVNTNPTATGPFGPNYTGTLTEGATAVSTLSEGFTSLTTGANATNSFNISETGVISAAASTLAARTFAASLSPGATYALTLTRTAGSTVGALGTINLTLGAGGTQFLNTSSGQGLAGIVDVLGLFGTNNTATFQFTVPAGNSGPLTFGITSNESATALGANFTLSSATITQVPEPRTVATMLLGAVGLVVLRCRRRLQAV